MTVTILGWIWSQGTLKVDPHKLNPLQACPLPSSVKQMRSFIGAYKAISKCIPNYSNHLGPLEDSVAGKESKEKLVWNDQLTKSFQDAQAALNTAKVITIPSSNDQLVISFDGCRTLPATGATLYIQRSSKILVGGFFSTKLSKAQLKWLPCEIEALSIKLGLNSFEHFVRESKHTTRGLTDSKPCIQAFNKLGRGEFSLSPRISSFLMTLNSLNITLHHLSGSDNILSDFGSRNPIDCVNESCQVCRFVQESSDLSVNSLTVSDIQNNLAKMPFTNVPAWKSAQKADADLKRVFAQLSAGSRPGRKERNIQNIRRYLQVTTISNSGLLIVRKPNPYGKDYELIVVPQSLVPGLITALHLKLSHPTRYQLKTLWNKYFFALNVDRAIDDCTNSCHLCNSVKSVPSELFEQTSIEVPRSIGIQFSADVLRRSGQKILLVRDIFSSFTVGLIVPNERADALREGLLQATTDLKHPTGSLIRVDDAPGFIALQTDNVLTNFGIQIDLGRTKNVNKNATADKAVQEIEKEIKRLVPDGGPITPSTLALAVSNVNSRIRFNGLSAREIVLKRDQYTGEPLSFPDSELAIARQKARERNHKYSELSKAKGGKPATSANVNKGDLVHIKAEGDKHTSRDFYLVVNINTDEGGAVLQKFVGNQLRSKKYLVKLTEIYQATPQVFHHSPSGSNAEDFAEDFVDNTNFELYQFLDNEEDVDPDEEADEQIVEGDQNQRLTRNRYPPSWIRSGDFIVGENFENMDLESS